MKKSYSGLNSIIEKHEGSWADVIMDIGLSTENFDKKMDLYIEILGKIKGDSSTINILHREMKYTRLEMVEHNRAINSEREKHIKNLETLAITDELTGLYNSRFFYAILDKTIARVDRGNEDASLIIADIDNFKLFNDNYGHLAGDKVLRVMGSTLKSEIRKLDVACRYGGEEFGVILPDTDEKDALDVAYRLNRKVSGCPIEFEDESGNMYNLPVSVSIGVGQVIKGDSAKNLVNRVDKYLYKAKEAGKNCVVSRDGRSVPRGQMSEFRGQNLEPRT